MSDSWKGMVKAKHPITQIYNNNNLKNKKKNKKTNKPTSTIEQCNNMYTRHKKHNMACAHNQQKTVFFRMECDWTLFIPDSASQIHFTRFIRLIKVFSIVMRIKCNF